MLRLLAILALTMACFGSPSAERCAQNDLESCRADMVHCAVVARCEGPSLVCGDQRVCQSATCNPTAVCVISREGECLAGRADAGFECLTVRDGGTTTCRVQPDPCEGCTPRLLRCEGRPGPAFGR